ncbi:MAG: hypothetical protein V4722_22910 [Bacteroidota bacterium]
MKCRNFVAALLMITGIAEAQQIPQALATQLQGKTKLKEIMGTVNTYYGFTPGGASKNNRELPGTSAAYDPTVLRTLKHWARFEWEMSSRVTARGDLFDYNKYLLEQTRRYETAHPEMNGVAQSAGGNWVIVGPTNVIYGHDRIIGQGRIDRIAFHPTNASIFYVGAPGGGLWRTTDGGSNYTCLTNSFPNMSVSGIVVDYNNANNIYVLTGDTESGTGTLVDRMGYRRGGIGVWKSTNGGSSWQQLDGAAVTGNGYRLVQDPNNPNVLLAATTTGIFRTINGGVDWTLQRSGNCHDVSFKPGSSTTIYACGPTSGNYWFRVSDNGGTNFNTLATFSHSIANTNRACIGVSPNSPSTVYLLCGPGNTANGTFTGFFRSTNSGINFTRQSNSPDVFVQEDGTGSDQSNSNNCIAVSPANVNRVVVGGLIVFGSTNGGGSFSPLTQYLDGTVTERDDHIHPDQHSLAFNPVDGKLYACNDGGLFVSSDNGTSWSRRFANLPTTMGYHMDVYGGDTDQMLVGSQDNGIHKREGATATFYQANQGDGFDIDYMHNDEDKYFAVINQKVYRIISNGLTKFEKLDWGNRFFPAMTIHATNTDRFFAGVEYMHRYTCNNGIDDDDVINVPSSWAIAVCPSNANRIYAAGDSSFGSSNNFGRGSMRRSDDGGNNWTRLDDNTDFPDMDSVPKITYIGVRPNNSDYVWITIGGGPGVPGRVYASSNAGASWSNITQGLPDVPVNCIAIDENNNAYIGNDLGVFFRGSGWASWKPFSNNLPRCPVTDIKLSPQINRIRASLFGRGIWSSDMYSDCELNVSVSGSKEGQQFWEAAGTVTTTAASTDGPGTEIYYRGGTQVDMKTGFEVANNSQAIVRTGPCNSGIPSFDSKLSATRGDYSGFRNVKMPPQDKKKFPFAFIKDWQWRNNQLDAQIEQVKDGALSLILVDEEGEKLADLWSRPAQVSGGGLPLSLSIDPVLKTKRLSALLFYNDQLVHWQELTP